MKDIISFLNKTGLSYCYYYKIFKLITKVFIMKFQIGNMLYINFTKEISNLSNSSKFHDLYMYPYVSMPNYYFSAVFVVITKIDQDD